MFEHGLVFVFILSTGVYKLEQFFYLQGPILTDLIEYLSQLARTNFIPGQKAADLNLLLETEVENFFTIFFYCCTLEEGALHEVFALVRMGGIISVGEKEGKIFNSHWVLFAFGQKSPEKGSPTLQLCVVVNEGRLFQRLIKMIECLKSSCVGVDKGIKFAEAQFGKGHFGELGLARPEQFQHEGYLSLFLSGVVEI